MAWGNCFQGAVTFSKKTKIDCTASPLQFTQLLVFSYIFFWPSDEVNYWIRVHSRRDWRGKRNWKYVKITTLMIVQVLLTPTHLAIVMEYAAEGELFERICNAGRFSEDEVVLISVFTHFALYNAPGL